VLVVEELPVLGDGYEEGEGRVQPERDVERDDEPGSAGGDAVGLRAEQESSKGEVEAGVKEGFRMVGEGVAKGGRVTEEAGCEAGTDCDE